MVFGYFFIQKTPPDTPNEVNLFFYCFLKCKKPKIFHNITVNIARMYGLWLIHYTVIIALKNRNQIALLHLYTNHDEAMITNLYTKSLEGTENRRSVPGVLVSAQNLLYAVKSELPTRLLLKEIAMLDSLKLARDLNHEDDRKAFWINIYNAFFQLGIEQYTSLTLNKLRAKKLFIIAGNKLSLDQIENGLLKQSSLNVFGFWFKNPLPTRFEEMLRVRADYRIHFVINKGGSQDPSIRFYSGKKLEEELNLATQEYLKKFVVVDNDRQVVIMPDKFNLFMTDFGSSGHIKELLKMHNIMNEETSNYTISYRKESCVSVPGKYYVPQPVFSYAK